MAHTGKLWGGRFSGSTETDSVLKSLNSSLPVDARMWREDVIGSQAYARALESADVVTREEADSLVSGLADVGRAWASRDTLGILKEAPEVSKDISQEESVEASEIPGIDMAAEDIHSANESLLGSLIGSATAGKLHTGRSRNDQVATDTRLWLMGASRNVQQRLIHLVSTLTKRARSECKVLLPGYTHLQRAQPIRWSLLLLSHAYALTDDFSRIADLFPRISALPLGSGALAGNPHPIDREQLRSLLGFDSLCPNALLAVASRDYIAEFLFCASLIQIHLSRLAEDLIIYSSSEFNFVSLSDAFSTGSSLMPQKKNPDSLELIRGKCGRVVGSLVSILMILKALPTAYNKDLQEDKEGLFDAVDTIQPCLQIMAGVIETMTIHPEKMQASLTPDLLATDLADYIIHKSKVPFREAHHISGRIVALAESLAIPVDTLTLPQLHEIHPCFEADVSDVWSQETSVERRDSIGGTSLRSVMVQIEHLESWVAQKSLALQSATPLPEIIQ